MSLGLSGAASDIVFRGSLRMPALNTPQKMLESWKQIAAYLERSERTVRRWEAAEGLPVHRREHEKQDTVFAFRHEIEAWSRLRTKCSAEVSVDEAEDLVPVKPTNAYLAEHDAIARTMLCYIAAARAGDGDLMRPALILPRPSRATVKESNIPALSNTSSSGSLRTVRHRTLVPALHALKSSRASLSFIWKSNVGLGSWRVPMPELPTYSLCSSGTASGRSRISYFTGTTNELRETLTLDRPRRARRGVTFATMMILDEFTGCPFSVDGRVHAERESSGALRSTFN
jgi:hypothetical protein